MVSLCGMTWCGVVWVLLEVEDARKEGKIDDCGTDIEMKDRMNLDGINQ